MKVICSTRDDSIGIGTLLILNVTERESVQYTEDTILVTDDSGENYEVYDVVFLDDLK